MKVEQIEFINWQGHRHSLLSLGGGLNVITGRTHSGKSSLMRGVEWVLENRPRGDNFRRDFMPEDDSVTVSISFDNNSWVSREKNPNKKINSYACSEYDEPFVALRTDVPTEIREVTKLSDVNVQSQGDKYFLLGKTPGQVATELNKVVGLQIIDDKKTLAKRKVLGYTNRISVLSTQIEETFEELESPQFKAVDELNSLIAKIDNSVESYERKGAEILSVERVVEIIESEKERAENLSDTISISKHLLPIKEKVRTFNKKEADIIEVIDKLAYIESWEAELEEIDKILSIEGDLKAMKAKIKAASAFALKLSQVNTLYKGIGKAELSKEHVLQEIAECELLKSELAKKKKKAEEKLNYCSKCGADKKYWRKERT